MRNGAKSSPHYGRGIDLLSATKKRHLAVVHSFPVWLPLTQAWMYQQLRNLPAQIECHIVCEKTANLDQFYWPNLHSLEQCVYWRRYLDLVLRLARIRR